MGPRVLGNKKNKLARNNFSARDDARNISDRVRPGDGPGYPGDLKENDAPDQVMGTKNPPFQGQKVPVNSGWTVKVKPGCESHTPKILSLLAKINTPNKGEQLALSKAQNGAKTGTPSGSEVLPAKESARVSWADIVKREKKKA